MNPAQLNTTRVLREIWLHPGISRIEIAQKLTLDKSTISLIVSNLVKKKLIRHKEDNIAGPKGGRKKVLLELNEKYGHIVGLEIQSDYYRLVVINLKSEIVHSQSAKRSIDRKNMLVVIEQIIADIKDRFPQFNLLGVGIGFTGIVNPQFGSIYYSIPLQITQPFQFTDTLKQQLGLPVLIENDANCGAWSELGQMKNDRAENFIFVLMKFWDTNHQNHFAKIGLGLGIVINGKVYHGSNFSAGEFKSIFGDGSTKSQFAISDEEIENIPEDPVCTQNLIRELSANMALLVNTFNLEKVIVGCDVSVEKDFILQSLSTEITNNWHYPFDTRYEVVFSEISENIVSLGAAKMFLERIFELSLDNQTHGINYLKMN